MPVYLFLVLFLRSRDKLNWIFKEAILFDEKDNGLGVAFTFIHGYVVLEKHPTPLNLLIYKLRVQKRWHFILK